MPQVTVTAASASPEAPVSAEFVLSLTQSDQAVDLYRSRSDLVKFLLSKLQEKSSKHKFLIQVTSVGSDAVVDVDLQIASSFGAAWDNERDGYVNVKVDNAPEDTTTDVNGGKVSSILITLYWISID